MQSEFDVYLLINDCGEEETPLNIAFISLCVIYSITLFLALSFWLPLSLSLYRYLSSYWDIKHTGISFLPLCFCPYIINVTFPVTLLLLFPN